MVKKHTPDIIINSPLYCKKDRQRPYTLLNESQKLASHRTAGSSCQDLDHTVPHSSVGAGTYMGRVSSVKALGTTSSTDTSEPGTSSSSKAISKRDRELGPPGHTTKLLAATDDATTQCTEPIPVANQSSPVPNGSCGNGDTQVHTEQCHEDSDCCCCCCWCCGIGAKDNEPIILDPTGQYTYYWSFFVIGAFLYNLWVIVYRYAFHEIGPDNMTKWFVLDYGADLIYIADIIVGFRVGYFRDGVLQTDRERVRQRYVNSNTFYIDCLAILPLDFLYLSLGYNSLFRILRLVKVTKFWAFVDSTECSTNCPNVFRTVVLLHYLMVAFHWNSCLVYSIARAFNLSLPIGISFSGIISDSQPTSVVNLSTNHLVGSQPGENIIISPYLSSLYWSALALTTFGDMPRPRYNGDYILCITQILLGVVLFATLMGQVSSLILAVRTQEKEYQTQVDAIKTYMRKRNVPKKFQEKVRKWLNYMRLSKKSPHEEKVIEALPTKLKAEMAIYVHLETLKQVEIFQNTDSGFLRQLVLKLKPVLFSPGDLVCVKGEVGREMYIVNMGILHILGGVGDKSVILVLRAGSYFGEISVLNMGPERNRRTASIKSVGYSELFSLSKDDLWEVLKEYPNARTRLESIASHRLTLASPNFNRQAKKDESTSTTATSDPSGSVGPSHSDSRRSLMPQHVYLDVPKNRGLGDTSTRSQKTKKDHYYTYNESRKDGFVYDNTSPSISNTTDNSTNGSSLVIDKAKLKATLKPNDLISHGHDRSIAPTQLKSPRRHSCSPNGKNGLTITAETTSFNAHYRKELSTLDKELCFIFKQNNKLMRLNKSISFPYIGGVKQYSEKLDIPKELEGYGLDTENNLNINRDNNKTRTKVTVTDHETKQIYQNDDKPSTSKNSACLSGAFENKHGVVVTYLDAPTVIKIRSPVKHMSKTASPHILNKNEDINKDGTQKSDDWVELRSYHPDYLKNKNPTKHEYDKRENSNYQYPLKFLPTCYTITNTSNLAPATGQVGQKIGNRRFSDLTYFTAFKGTEINSLNERIKALEKQNLILSQKLLSDMTK